MLLTPLDVAIRGLSGPVRLAPTPLEVALRGLVAPVRFAEEVAGPQSLFNVEKLSLDPATPVGTQVSVSDGFVLHDSVYGDVFYYTNGTAPSGGTAPAIEKYSPANRPDLDDITWRWNNANDASEGGAWGDGGGNYAGLGDDSVTHFWETPVDTIDHTYTFTHPAIQSLAAASTAQGGVFVSGGTQDGVYAVTSRDHGGVPDAYNLLGLPSDGSLYAINKAAFTYGEVHTPASDWHINDGSGVLQYYSLDGENSVELVIDWKNASDDSPASISFTSVTKGELASGLRISDVTYRVNGSLNGRNVYSDVLGVEEDVSYRDNGSGPVWSDGATDIPANTSFPWDAGLGERDDVTAEENWQTA